MSAPGTADTSITSGEAKKRGLEEDDGDKSNKKQKKLTKYEQQEDTLRKQAKELKESVAKLQKRLQTLSLLDDMRNLELESLSDICGRNQSTTHTRRASELTVLQLPIRLLEGDELSGSIPGK
jgi:DNA-directed RNA polymerase specialized sigma24 family protein